MISLFFFLAVPAAANNVEMDLLGSLSESFSSNALSLVPSASATATATAEGNVNLYSTTSFAAPPPSSNNFNQVGICLIVSTF